MTAATALVTMLVIINPDTPAAVASLDSSAGARDLIAAYPSEYLLVLYYGDASLDARTRAIASSIPWFWGTAVYPPDAMLTAVPPASGSGGGRGLVRLATRRSAGTGSRRVHRDGRSCWTGVCVTMLSPKGLTASGDTSNH